jgi:hypothetical protein
MITRLNQKNVFDVLSFLSRNSDSCQEMYITKDKQRIFLKNNLKLIKRILEHQECYGWFSSEMFGLLIVYREKEFRPYLKILADTTSVAEDLIKFFNWNNHSEVFVKIKKYNNISRILQSNKFRIMGFRGQEILLKKEKDVREITNGTRPTYQKS